MVTTPAVSVLMTAYNRESYIAAAIESVLAQRFADFELIVVDDCSSDGTRAIAEEYARADSRVRVFANEKNLGDYGNRNRAATYARGPLLKYHDSDDVLYPHGLEVMLACMAAAPEAAFGLSHAKKWPGGPCPMLLSPHDAYAREFLGYGVFQCGPAGAIIRTDVFRAAGGFKDLGVFSDFVMWLQLARQHSLVLMPADLVWYREHSAQELRRPQAAYAYAHVNRYAWDALHAPECPLAGDELERARCNQAANVVKQILRDVKRGHLALAAHRVAQSGLSAGQWVRYLRRPVRSTAAGTPLGVNGDVALPEWVRVRHETTGK